MTYVRNNQREKSVVSKTEWHIAVYLRLSKEDGDKPESDSIQNQRKIIENHLKHLESQGENIASVEFYSDDGYSGGNFDRPDYQRMIRDIEAGIINCIVFKDNSRLGRNYTELGRLMEDYFPQKKVRVISVLNNIDSLRDPATYSSAMVSFSNIMNDDYIRQLSIKIKSTFAMKRERGEFLGNYAPYGYEKSPEDRHKLVIDPEAAQVVRMMFRWYSEGMSASGIVRQLNALHITPPSVYKTQKGCKGFTTHASGGVKKEVWSITTVNTMLQDEVYIGNMVQGKYKSASYHTKKLVQAEESDWTVVEGTHEPIVSEELFAIAHDRFARHTRVPPHRRTPHLLSGYVKCAQCGGRMNRVVSQGIPRYRCMTHLSAPEKCSCTSVREELLENTLREALQVLLNELVDAKAVIDEARKRRDGGSKHNEYSLAIRRAEREKERLAQAKFRLYDNYQQGVIGEEEYRQFGERYAREMAEQDAAIRRLQENLSQAEEARRQDDEFVAYFAQFGAIRTLDRTILNELLDHIEYADPTHIHIFVRFSPERKKILDFAKDAAVC